MKGIGTDITSVNRLRNSVEKYQALFLDKVFTPAEQQLALKKGESKYQFYAGRWAAKEAVSKVLGTGFGANCGWLDLEILNDELGKPCVTISGNAKQTADRLGIRSIQVSISHEQDYAVAFAIGE